AYGSRRHKRTRAIDVADRFGHRLSHIGARMKVELHQGHALDIATFDVVDAADIEEVILVVIGDQSFHLARVHAAVRLGNIDHWQIEPREDVDLDAREGQAASEYDGHHGDHDRDRPPHRELN